MKQSACRPHTECARDIAAGGPRARLPAPSKACPSARDRRVLMAGIKSVASRGADGRVSSWDGQEWCEPQRGHGASASHRKDSRAEAGKDSKIHFRPQTTRPANAARISVPVFTMRGGPPRLKPILLHQRLASRGTAVRHSTSRRPARSNRGFEKIDQGSHGEGEAIRQLSIAARSPPPLGVAISSAARVASAEHD